MVTDHKKKNNSIKSIFKKIVSSVGSKKKEKKVNSKKVISDVKISKKKTIKTGAKKIAEKALNLKNKIVLKKKKFVPLKTKKKVENKKEKKVDSKDKIETTKLKKVLHNPVLSPSIYGWESQGVFNPAAIVLNNKVHLFYRALGEDGISRIGYASSDDGINFKERLTYPIYYLQSAEDTKKHWPFTSPARPVYDKALYSSGGGWGGCEDPRTVVIDGTVYMTLNIFNGWNSLRVGVISIKESDLLKKKWNWSNLSYITKLGDRQKNWVLFPEKFDGKFAIFHNLDLGDPTRVGVTFVSNLDDSESPLGSAPGSAAPDPQRLPDHIVAWHKHTRSASCPPIKTKEGWLLLYHAMDKDGNNLYKLGAMILDLKDPRKVLYRANNPILEPQEWYENDWKPGIIYASGAVIRKNTLYVYYGGGDKYVCIASIPLKELMDSLKNDKIIKLKNIKKIKNK